MCLKEEETARNSKLYSLLASGRRRERESEIMLKVKHM